MEILNPKQHKAAILIASGKPKKEAAKTVGASAQTVSKWLGNPEFVALINKTKREMMEETRDMLRGNLITATETINELLKIGKNEKVRFEAAKFLIEATGIITPDIGLWDTGPQTVEEVENEMIQKGIMPSDISD
ncbi:phBC6A51 family helix-turn-helix protein [Desulfobacter curvatus]|uniref:phBC6A51 family helix-turn-helix protein n=1 Tax=Desulfobacter curvatus TaxID=2290 RepID=UPI00037AA22D|nr:phBC6A51 family helix-turn-helix protein [Desulfobacter curvatus]